MLCSYTRIMFSPAVLRKQALRTKPTIRNKRKPSGYFSHFLKIASVSLLSIGALLGALLVLICGSSQYGLSMLASVVQGTSSVLLSLEIKSSITENILPSKQVKVLLFLGVTYIIHFAIITSEGEKCDSLCQNYFNQIRDRNVLTGQNSSLTTQVFTDQNSCLSACELSMKLFKYSIGGTGMLHISQCALLWLLYSCSTNFTSTGDQSMLEKLTKATPFQYLRRASTVVR